MCRIYKRRRENEEMEKRKRSMEMEGRREERKGGWRRRGCQGEVGTKGQHINQREVTPPLASPPPPSLSSFSLFLPLALNPPHRLPPPQLPNTSTPPRTASNHGQWPDLEGKREGNISPNQKKQSLNTLHQTDQSPTSSIYTLHQTDQTLTSSICTHH